MKTLNCSIPFGPYIGYTKRGAARIVDNIEASEVKISRERTYVDFRCRVILPSGRKKMVGASYFSAESLRELMEPLFDYSARESCRIFSKSGNRHSRR